MRDRVKMRAHVMLFVFLLASSSAIAARCVTDESGRTILVTDAPHCSLRLIPRLTETVFALGAGDALVGGNNFSELPPEPRAKPNVLRVALTGRDARPEILEIADLATEMRLLKHPFKHGISAQKGIEF